MRVVLLHRPGLILLDVIDDSLHMQRHDSLLPLLRFQELQAELVIHKPILREYRSAVGVLEDVERRFEIRVTVGPVLPDVMAL